MAILNGTQVGDSIAGVAYEDDLIFGFGGDDTIHGADGNDTIYGGAGNDNILGGDGDDVLYGGAGADWVRGGAGDDLIVVEIVGDVDGDTIRGGAGEDTLSIALADGDIVNGAASFSGFTADVAGIEFIRVSNSTASGDAFEFKIGEDTSFALDGEGNATFRRDGHAVGTDTIDLSVLSYDGVTHDVAAATVTQSAGIDINGEIYEDGDTFTTAAGGTVLVIWNAGAWQLEYTTPTTVLTSIVMGTQDIVDETLAVKTSVGGEWIDGTVELTYNIHGGTINLTGFTNGVRVQADNTGTNNITDGAGNDTIIGGDSTENVTITGGDNSVRTLGGDDFIYVTGNGADSIWAGEGDDVVVVDVGGDGNKTIGLGEGNDSAYIYGDGDSHVFGAAGNDRVEIYGDGDNRAWGGDGNDTVVINGDGNNVIGAGVGDDIVAIGGDGDNVVYAAAGNDTVALWGEGANEIWLGEGDDHFVISGSATGENTVNGGAGNDLFDLGVGSKVALVFEAGSGSDVINGFDLSGDHKVDLSAFDFVSADEVVAKLLPIDAGANAMLVLGAGHTITFNGLLVTDLSAANPADWLIL